MLTRYLKSALAVGLLVNLVFTIQIDAQESTDNIILKAMKDELDRNMASLAKEDHEKPFFIGYTIANINSVRASAKYGALTGSSENNFKDWSVRVMVGDYELNDENFNADQGQDIDNRMVFNMPQENDYLGMRRALWSQTDKVYNSAAKLYKQKKALIAGNKVDEELLQINDFSKVNPVQIRIPQISNTSISLQDAEKRSKAISKIFLSYPEVHNSNVAIHTVNADAYFINSENTEVVYPLNYSTINVSFTIIGDDGERFNRILNYGNISVDELPSNDIVFEDIAYLIKDIGAAQKLDKFDDEYSGPVLFTDDVAIQVLESALFSGNKKIIGSRKPLKRNDQYTSDYNFEKKKKDWKIGEKVIDPSLSVTDYSSMSTYRDKKLWGSYKVDGEGVVPLDSLVLIEQGILKTRYNSRTPSDDVGSSNGHYRHSIRMGGVSKTIAPGVMHIKSTETKTIKELRLKLLELAKDDGYEYGIIARPAPLNTRNKITEYYKVDVESGKETRLRGVSYNTIKDREFKKIAGIADDFIAVNKMFDASSAALPSLSSIAQIAGGVPVSVIGPAGVLLKRVDLSASGTSYKSKKPIVPSPMKE